MAYNDNNMIIIETSVFTKQVLKLLSDDEYRLMQAVLVNRPDGYPVISGGGGLRKIRWVYVDEASEVECE